MPLCRLRSRRANENLPFAILVHEIPEPLLNPPVEVPNRGKILRLGHDMSGIDIQAGFGNGQHLEFRRVLEVHAFGPLQEEEVP